MSDEELDPHQFLTLDQVAEELATSHSQVYALVRRGELRSIKLGGRGQWRVRRPDLEAWIAKLVRAAGGVRWPRTRSWSRKRQRSATSMTPEDYFDERNLRNQALRWAVGTRLQLDRWEPLVARIVRHHYDGGQPSPELSWRARNEHHLTIVMANHLVVTVPKLSPAMKGMPGLLHDEIHESRDLLEHWLDNQHFFNSTPRPPDPRSRKTGKAYAARNPRGGPYGGYAHDNRVGAKLTPHVSADDVRQLVAAVERYAVDLDPELSIFVPTTARPSCWDVDGHGNIWPKALAELDA